MVSLPGLLHLVSSNGEPSGLLRLKISGLSHNSEPSWASSLRFSSNVEPSGLLRLKISGLIHNGGPSWAFY